MMKKNLLVGGFDVPFGLCFNSVSDRYEKWKLLSLAEQKSKLVIVSQSQISILVLSTWQLSRLMAWETNSIGM